MIYINRPKTVKPSVRLSVSCKNHLTTIILVEKVHLDTLHFCIKNLCTYNPSLDINFVPLPQSLCCQNSFVSHPMLLTKSFHQQKYFCLTNQRISQSKYLFWCSTISLSKMLVSLNLAKGRKTASHPIFSSKYP